MAHSTPLVFLGTNGSLQQVSRNCLQTVTLGELSFVSLDESSSFTGFSFLASLAYFTSGFHDFLRSFRLHLAQLWGRCLMQSHCCIEH